MKKLEVVENWRWWNLKLKKFEVDEFWSWRNLKFEVEEIWKWRNFKVKKLEDIWIWRNLEWRNLKLEKIRCPPWSIDYLDRARRLGGVRNTCYRLKNKIEFDHEWYSNKTCGKQFVKSDYRVLMERNIAPEKCENK